MFDHNNNSISQSDPRGEAIKGLDRLCRAFDPLLSSPNYTLHMDQKSELASLARIFDLPTNRDPASVWADVRSMLVAKPAAEKAAPTQTLTIMLVEDDPDLAAEVMSALTAAGHRLIGPFESAGAADVSSALHPIDVALVDLHLANGTSGAELARSLKARWAVPLILMSADVTALAATGSLGDAIVMKPFKTETLLEAITTVTGELALEHTA